MSKSQWNLRPHGASLKCRQLSNRPETPASEAPALLGAVRRVFGATARYRTLVVLSLAVMMLALLIPATHAQTVFNCPSFNGNASGACSAAPGGSSNEFRIINGGNLSGSGIDMVPSTSTHNSYGLWYYAPVNVQAFTTSFTFVPNGQNFAFVVQHTTNAPGYEGNNSVSGAGCESGFYQAFVPPNVNPNNVFALEFDSYSPLTLNAPFTNSSVQIYQQNQSPCNPNDDGPNYFLTNKFSTYPVSFNSPVSSQNTTTKDTYSATITYDGSNLTLNMYNVTAGGSCPGASCFTHEWSNVAIPSLVDSTTGYVGFDAGIGIPATYPQYINSFSYTVHPPTASPSSSPPSAGGTPAANPTYSPAPGTYSGTQSVALSSSTPGANICYTLSSPGLVITPTPNNLGGCAVGTPYTGPIAVSSSQTLYAIAGTDAVGLPSGIAQGNYVIGSGSSGSGSSGSGSSGSGSSGSGSSGSGSSGSGGSTATPTFSPGADTYSSAQSVTLSDATSGATMYYTTNGTTPTTSSTEYTGPITVSSTETLQAIAAATGDSNSAVASAAYTMDPPSSGSGNTPVINYSTGFAAHPSQLWLENNSVYSGSSIELTNSRGGSANNAWYKTPVNVQAFTTTFTWNAICPAKPALCGDGMGFMIISNSNPSSAGFNYSGSSGGQLSWSSCYSASGGTLDCPPIKSILVKFDLYNNSTGTDGANLTGFYSGGVYPQPPQPAYDMTPSAINMQSGHLMKATLTYNGTVLMEAVTDTTTGATYRNSYSVNIPSVVGGDTAFVGFGGGTGSATVTQNIQSWTYTVD
jgi:Chitobiase/beta-hexosaminidase C-terminal domain/Legume lectin domain